MLPSFSPRHNLGFFFYRTTPHPIIVGTVEVQNRKRPTGPPKVWYNKPVNKFLVTIIATAVVASSNAQSYGGAQYATNGHSYSLAGTGVGKDKPIAYYDSGKTLPRAWINYGAVAGFDLTDNIGVAGIGVWGFYEFSPKTNFGVTGSVSNVWPQGGKNTFVIGAGLGWRF